MGEEDDAGPPTRHNQPNPNDILGLKVPDPLLHAIVATRTSMESVRHFVNFVSKHPTAYNVLCWGALKEKIKDCLGHMVAIESVAGSALTKEDMPRDLVDRYNGPRAGWEWPQGYDWPYGRKVVRGQGKPDGEIDPVLYYWDDES